MLTMFAVVVAGVIVGTFLLGLLIGGLKFVVKRLALRGDKTKSSVPEALPVNTKNADSIIKIE